MSGEELRRTVIVKNTQGLHMRPITAFVEMATKFQSNVSVSRNGQPGVNGKSPLAMLGLAAEQGTELVVQTQGPDAQEALETLVAFLDELKNSDP
jgi:phosphotransferase system HPr (HPr) family protein